MKEKKYSVRKCRYILHLGYKWYKKRRKTLSSKDFSFFEDTLKNLETALSENNHPQSEKLAKEAQSFIDHHFKRKPHEFFLEFIVAIIIAFSVAILVRQMCFEPFFIPTGSMRPSFKEKDGVIVSKTAFGINVPLRTRHFYFDKNLIIRGGTVIIAGDNLALPDTDATYFGIIPYKKRYIKRLIGKPGDSLYFYGGKIYGVDAAGDPITELLDSPFLKKIEHLPFMDFEGETQLIGNREIQLRFFQKVIARIPFSLFEPAQGEIFVKNKWVPEDTNGFSFRDFFGIRNFAKARLLTKEEVEKFTSHSPKDLEEGILYLELRHSPNLTTPTPRFYKLGNQTMVSLGYHHALIPLKKEHLNAIMDNLYTSRFVIKNKRATRYNAPPSAQSLSFPNTPPNGTYEFYFGILQNMGWGAIAYTVPHDHPLYNHSPENIQKLFNVGIEFSAFYEPYAPFQNFPHRYGYFRDGDLYLMGAPIIKKDDPTLIAFHKKEEQKEKESNPLSPYIAFKDFGPPLKKDGTFDIDFIQKFGVTVPENHYLVLGDNHAMSSDSRIFGFVPEENIQGIPTAIVWPPGKRWGILDSPYPWITLPRIVVWGGIFGIIIIGYGFLLKKRKKRLFQ